MYRFGRQIKGQQTHSASPLTRKNTPSGSLPFSPLSSSQMGCYQEGIAKDSVAGKDVTAHIFEYACLGHFLPHTLTAYTPKIYQQCHRH
jgi:hypothetical protein